MKMPFSLPKLNSSRKARSRALTLSIIIGIITFALSTFGGKLAMGKVSSVVVAAGDLEPGQVITDKDLKDAGKMSGTLPPDVITSKSQVVGLSLAYPVKAGQPLVKGVVSNTPMRNGLYPGEVGVWVGVTLTTSGLVKPGDLIDVYLTPGSTGSNYGKAIPSQMVNSLQGVRVVSVINNSGQPVQANATGNPNSNVPAAVELAIPKVNADAFSQLSIGRVSLMLDPFATPKTPIANASLEANTSSGVSQAPTSIPNTMEPITSTSGTPNTTVPVSNSSAPTQQGSSASTSNQPAQNHTNPSALPSSSNNMNSPAATSPNNGTYPGGYNPPMFDPNSSNK